MHWACRGRVRRGERSLRRRGSPSVLGKEAVDADDRYKRGGRHAQTLERSVLDVVPWISAGIDSQQLHCCLAAYIHDAF